MSYNFEATILALFDKYGLEVLPGYFINEQCRGWAK